MTHEFVSIDDYIINPLNIIYITLDPEKEYGILVKVLGDECQEFSFEREDALEFLKKMKKFTPTFSEKIRDFIEYTQEWVNKNNNEFITEVLGAEPEDFEDENESIDLDDLKF